MTNSTSVGDATLKEVGPSQKIFVGWILWAGTEEEFVVAMPETRMENACEVAERIRSNIARHDFRVTMTEPR